MALEEQLEFPFLQTLRLHLYSKHQIQDIKDLYKIYTSNERFKNLTYTTFIQDVWVKGGYANRFYERNKDRFFYDIPKVPNRTGEK